MHNYTSMNTELQILQMCVSVFVSVINCVRKLLSHI